MRTATSNDKVGIIITICFLELITLSRVISQYQRNEIKEHVWIKNEPCAPKDIYI